jgi:hypothetical protein
MNRDIRFKSRMSISLFILFFLTLLVTCLLRYLAGIEEGRLWPMAIILGAILLAGLYFQLSMKCPSCGFRLALSTSLGAPAKCIKCGADIIQPISGQNIGRAVYQVRLQIDPAEETDNPNLIWPYADISNFPPEEQVTLPDGKTVKFQHSRTTEVITFPKEKADQDSNPVAGSNYALHSHNFREYVAESLDSFTRKEETKNNLQKINSQAYLIARSYLSGKPL